MQKESYKMLNLYVTHGSDGNEVKFENDNEVKSNLNNLAVFMQQFDADDCCTVEQGLKELEDYRASTYNDNEDWESVKSAFLQAVEGKVGKFYTWGIEYDCDLMFIEEGEQLISLDELVTKLEESEQQLG